MTWPLLARERHDGGGSQASSQSVPGVEQGASPDLSPGPSAEEPHAGSGNVAPVTAAKGSGCCLCARGGGSGHVTRFKSGHGRD